MAITQSVVVTDFAEIFDYFGGLGAFQVCLVFMVGFAQFLHSPQAMINNYVGYNQDHWCKVPGLQSYPHSHQKYVAIPYKDGSTEEYDECNMYDLPYQNYTQQQLLNWNRSDHNMDNYTVVSCANGWVYDQSMFVSTINSKWDLVCNDNWKTSFVSTVYMLGFLVGSFFAFVADRFGRQRVAAVSMLCAAAAGLACPFAPYYELYLVLRFVYAACNRLNFFSAYVAVMEFTAPSKRWISGIMVQMFGSFGHLMMCGVAFAVRDATYLQLCMNVPFVVIVVMYLLIPESPLWLVNKRRYNEATRVLQKYAPVNNRRMPADMTWKQPSSAEKGDEEPKKGSIVMCLLKSRLLMTELIIMWFLWFSNSLVYYGFSLNAGSYGSLFLNTFLNGAIEIPATLLSLIIGKVGRRMPLIVAFFISGASSLACIPIILSDRSDLQPLLVTLVNLGKGAGKFIWNTLYVFTAELFPTLLRPTTIGSSSVASRVGSMIAPFAVDPLVVIWSALPSTIFGVLGILSAALSILLPETLKYSLPDTIAEAEAIGRHETELRKKISTIRDGIITTGNDDLQKKKQDADGIDGGVDNVGFSEEQMGWGADPCISADTKM